MDYFQFFPRLEFLIQFRSDYFKHFDQRIRFTNLDHQFYTQDKFRNKHDRSYSSPPERSLNTNLLGRHIRTLKHLINFKTRRLSFLQIQGFMFHIDPVESAIPW